jgi:hypothetical protein
MLSWLRRRRDQAERIEAEAEALISDLGDGAYSEARRRAREASSDEMEREWSRVALAVARKTGRKVGLDTATRMVKDADFSVREGGTAGESEPFEETDPLDELVRIVAETPTRPPVSDSVCWGRRRTRDIDPERGQAECLRPVRSRPGGFPSSLACSRHRLPFDRSGRPGGLRSRSSLAPAGTPAAVTCSAL